jgi:L-iditol 2-dehydrogenase
MPELMRAGRLVATGRVAFEEAPIDPAREGEVLVRSHFGSICGSDLHGVQYGVEVLPFPCPAGYPGHEGIGEVVESRADGLAPGDIVLTVPFAHLGRTIAEYQRCAGTNAIKVNRPDAAAPLPPLEQVLMAQQLGTVIYALRRYPTDVAGKTVVIVGQGSAGLFFTYLLRRAGAARVIVADLSPARLKVSERFGADVRLDANVEDVTAAVADLTNGKGADYVVEAVGRRETLAQSIELAAMDTKLLWFGLPDTSDQVPVPFNRFFRKRLTAQTVYGAQGEPGLVSFRVALDLIMRGEIDVAPLLSHVLPIEDVERAFELAHSRDEGAVKVSVAF